MSYRDRRLARVERLREWSDKRATRAASTLNQAKQMADAIPFGQPILVGHHSEKRDRNYRERIRGKFERAYQDDKKAREMDSRADSIEHQAEQAIYSDDDDAIERLTEKIAGMEAERARIKEVNRLVRGAKGDAAKFAALPLTEAEREELIKLARICPYHQSLTRGFPAYALSNLGGNITRARARLALLTHGAKGQPRPAATDTATATARAGLVVTASMTTPSRPGKQPRAVWIVTGNLAEWRQMLIRLGGSWYRGAFSFFDDPTADIESACAESEDPIANVARAIETAERDAAPLADAPFALTPQIAQARGKQERLI
jgi:hypothetical protein